MKKFLFLLVVINLFSGCFLVKNPSKKIVNSNNKNEVKYNLPKEVEVPFITKDNYLAYWDYKDEVYKKFFIKGMNLGVGVPGTNAGNLSPDYTTYYRWFEEMYELGINTLRIYTLHYPRFYMALDDFNSKHADNPIYLFQGIWLDENSEKGDVHTLYDLTDESFSQEIEDLVDCVYGNKRIPHRYGKAYGDYNVNISRWVLGWIIGREIYPDEIERTNQLSKSRTFNGRYYSIDNAKNVSTAWAVEQIDHVISYEMEKYGHQRPISLSSWPTLDPLEHESEPGPPNSFEDYEAFYLEDIKKSNNDVAGYFASYHAYPYYPDFISYDPKYNDPKYSDDYGPNSYMGYLDDLNSYYNAKGIPLVIAETGVPSSWGNAKFAQSGMNHGGINEEMQGEYGIRIMKNIYDENCAGGVLFAWIDEWWKRTWITDEITFPRSRYALWDDITSPEENFGFIKFKPDNYPYKEIYRGENKNIESISAMANETYLNIKIKLSNIWKTEDTVVIGINSYDNSEEKLGSSILEDGENTQNGYEFTIVYPEIDEKGNKIAQLYVTKEYSLYGIWHFLDNSRKYSSTTIGEKEWEKVRWRNLEKYNEMGEVTKIENQNIGELGVANSNETIKSTDALIINDTELLVRVPWTLLQFSDPSRCAVIDGVKIDSSIFGKKNWKLQSKITDGVSFAVSINNDLIETNKYSWNGWGGNSLDNVDYSDISRKYVNNPDMEEKKNSYYILRKGLKSIGEVIK
ncbi:hypothetical protein [Haliovirga abyssi]|uniref:Glycoside hydrolase family 42 N-terminal domain-containing protein n=1 Tax=Haliovirga abyssi TaxID=2996794 RepID=A0AAU9DXP3_9FUSO|nr:hypothetical protein [Haliovirga abyssi]BDU51256.1 hypothetical protein HLVA_18250 [Haliovirga abyssi]